MKIKRKEHIASNVAATLSCALLAVLLIITLSCALLAALLISNQSKAGEVAILFGHKLMTMTRISISCIGM